MPKIRIFVNVNDPFDPEFYERRNISPNNEAFIESPASFDGKCIMLLSFLL